MNMERERLISVPLMEYKDLLSAKAELEIIYHKLESCTGTTEKYTFHEFVQNVHEALHPAQSDTEVPVPVIPGMAEPLVTMCAQDTVRSANAEQL